MITTEIRLNREAEKIAAMAAGNGLYGVVEYAEEGTVISVLESSLVTDSADLHQRRVSQLQSAVLAA